MGACGGEWFVVCVQVSRSEGKTEIRKCMKEGGKEGGKEKERKEEKEKI